MHSLCALSFAVVCPALLGLIGLMAPRRAIALRVGLAVAAPILSLAALAVHIAGSGLDAAPVGVAWMPSMRLDWAFQADRLGLFFALLVAGVGLLIVLYARAYFGPDQNALYRIYPSLLLFMTAMLGVVLSDSFLLLLLFWELTSISSFLLIGWERDDPAAVRNALQAFIVTGTGGIALLGGLILLGTTTGVWSFSQLSGGIDLADPKVSAALLLIVLGAFTKSAQWPFHAWLPAAMAAPTPVSAYLHSATMVKAGVYLLGRLGESMSGMALWPWLLIPAGVITMVLGAYVAIRKTDLKLIFAYTTVSQLGLLVCMYGLAAFNAVASPDHPAMLWDVTQILNHALYKAPLFILAGAIAHVTYSRDLRDLYGLFHQGKSERRMAVLMLLAAYAMAAGPFTLGFAGKELFLYGAYNAYHASGHPLLLGVIGAVVLQGALNVAVFTRFALTLLGPESGAATQPPHDPEAEEERIAYEDYHAIQSPFWSSMLWVPAALLLGLQYLGGIVPSLFDSLFGSIERTRTQFATLPGMWYAVAHPSWPLALSAIAIVLGAALALLPVQLGWGPVWRKSIHDWHERLFPAFYDLATKGGGRVFAFVQTGNLRTYLAVISGGLVLLVGWAVYLRGTGLSLPPHPAEVEPWRQQVPFYALGALTCLGALLMPFTQHRAGRVMLLGTVGFAVAGMFYLYNAPDVALTQVAIEIVGLILFLLALGLLPRTGPLQPERARTALRIVVAACVGAVMFYLTLASALEERPPMHYLNAEGKPFAHLGDFFLRNSYKAQDVAERHPGGGGNNVVNVILVDFRGLDTFGEITVLGIAALGVLVLLHRSGRGGRLSRDAIPHRPIQLRRLSGRTSPAPGRRRRTWTHNYGLSSEPLRIATKLLVPLSLLFALFIFFKGHQQPGGGFVGGLVAAIALIAHRMAHGQTSLRHMLPVRERILIGAGLLMALATGLGAVFLGRPFLTSRYGYIPLPGTDQRSEWATVLVFDLGVFLVVLGVVLAMINALNRESEEA